MLRQAEAEAVTATAVATATVIANATATARTAEFYNWIFISPLGAPQYGFQLDSPIGLPPSGVRGLFRMALP